MNIRGKLEAIMKFRIRYQRGLGWVGDLKYLMGLAIFLKLYGISEILIVPITIIGIIILYIIGKIDQDKGIWRMEANYHTEYINPYFEDMKVKINNIERRLNEL